ncbi:MAG TPA: hypothetical protein VMJ75_06660 [Candidatus Acidoferrales bacterium]|nr:hypothetical protein [Candidatus Acidoferrales bacterium]
MSKFLELSSFTIAALCTAFVAGAQTLPNLFPFPNTSGLLETQNVNGGKPLDTSGPFFQSLGTNGRTCATCHRPAEGWSVSTAELQLRFLLTMGNDPIFRTVDGSTCNHGVDTSTLGARSRAYSLLLNKGLVRIAIAVPPNAQFEVVSVVNPYGCSETDVLSMYRRPLPATNLRFLSAVMFDGRESSAQTGTQPVTYATNPADLRADLVHQALDATLGHAEAAAPPSQQQLGAIADFEMSLATAQAYDYSAGDLTAGGATGGPVSLGSVTMPAFFVGINDPLGGNPKGIPFTPAVFDLYDSWANAPSQSARAAIARGQAVFNSKPIVITGVAGLNDSLNLAAIPGTCGTCHDSPDVGNHSLPVALNIGVGDLSSPLDLSYLPVITLRNKTTGEIKQTTDPGRALITGQWADIGKGKGPILRGLASRAPYFHNGSAASLDDVVAFYDKRFNIGLTAQEKRDLVAFLKSL